MFSLIKPHNTEKSLLANKTNRYSFVVLPKANKITIAREVEKRYGVTVKKVNTARYQGKKITRHTRKGFFKGQRTSYKKAIVTLCQGEALNIHNEVS